MKRNWLNFWQNYRNIKIIDNQDLLFQAGKTVSSKPIEERQFIIIIRSIISSLNVGSNDRVLDLCCGNGILTYEIAKRCSFVFAIDFSETMINNTRKFKTSKNIEYLQYDIKKISEIKNIIFKKNINKVVMYDALAYFNKQELLYILSTLKNILNEKHSIFIGSILLSEKKYNFYNNFKRKLNYIVNHRLLHKDKGLGKWWSIRELRSIADQLDYKFKIIHQNPKLYTAHYRVDVLLKN